jgi:hypothetical protein
MASAIPDDVSQTGTNDSQAKETDSSQDKLFESQEKVLDSDERLPGEDAFYYDVKPDPQPDEVIQHHYTPESQNNTPPHQSNTVPVILVYPDTALSMEERKALMRRYREQRSRAGDAE